MEYKLIVKQDLTNDIKKGMVIYGIYDKLLKHPYAYHYDDERINIILEQAKYKNLVDVEEYDSCICQYPITRMGGYHDMYTDAYTEYDYESKSIKMYFYNPRSEEYELGRAIPINYCPLCGRDLNKTYKYKMRYKIYTNDESFE